MENRLTKEDFTSHNNVRLCGKIVKMNPFKYGVKVVLSCGRGKRMKKDKNGRYIRNVVGVKFFDKNAEYVTAHYKTGDMVTVNAVAQNTRNPITEDMRLEIWGLSMADKVTETKYIKDHDRVEIRGKVVSARMINESLIIVNVFTKHDKKYPNPIPSETVPFITESFRSVTPVGIWCKGDAKEAIKQYTSGTWIDISGFVDSKIKKYDDSVEIRNVITSLRTRVIGEVQPDVRQK